MDTSRPGEIAYLSDWYRVTRFSAGSPTLVVMFDYWRGERKGFPKSARWAAVSQLGFDQISISCARNDWFISEDTENLRLFLAGAVSRYEETVFFGSSMGGFGALLFSGLADRICLVSPQYSIDRRICAFESRWSSEAAGIKDFVDVSREGNRRTRGCLIYDPRYTLDARHAEMIGAAFPNLDRFCFPFAGHPATDTVRASGLSSNFTRAMIAGELTPSYARRLHRQGRRRSALYLTELAVRIKARSPHGARKLLHQALDVIDNAMPSEKKAPLLFRIASNLVDVGDYSRIHSMRWALNNKSSPPAWWRRRIRQSYQLRDQEAEAARLRSVKTSARPT